MAGRIRAIHLVTHVAIIIREFGWATYIRAWLVATRGGTFLEAVQPNFYKDKV